MLCAATSSISGDLPDKLKSIAMAGFDAVELSLADVAGFDGSLEYLANLITQNGLSLAALGPVAGAGNPDNILSKIKMARDLNAAVLLVHADASLPPANTRKGVRIALCVQGQSEADVLAKASEDWVGIALRSDAALADGSRPARLRDIPGEKVFHVCLGDGPFGPLLPGLGNLNLGGFVRVLKRAGYAGPWSVSSRMGGAANAYRALVNVLDDVAQTEPALRDDVPILPPRVPATGFEFIEFAVDEKSAAPLEAQLTSMSFRRERNHVSKDVALWRQGAVNIVVNKEPAGHARNAFVNHGPTVCDMGMRVSNAQDAVARAQALGTGAFAQDVKLGELAIPAIRGVGGSVMHFIDEKSDLHRVWDIEFNQVQRQPAIQPAGVRRIDHVAQTMKYDEMQNWLLFYISTFELEKTAVVNVTDPSGIVRSQAMTSPEGQVRLNLNGAEGHQTFAGGFVADKFGAGVQHVAFASDDIFETTAQLVENGFPFLQVPSNYYVETQGHFGLNDQQTARLKLGNILYDRDDDGEYFQLYSQPIFAGFFFEIVERRSGYSGFGARNASVRLAAQSKFKPIPGIPRR